jgi:hypothetical protein
MVEGEASVCHECGFHEEGLAQTIMTAVRAAVRHERNLCAQAARSLAGKKLGQGLIPVGYDAAEAIAKAIEARGEG